MRFLSVCSGIEAASVAWAPLGWHAAAVSEIEPFPSAVLSHRFPEVPNLGDFTRIIRSPALQQDVGDVSLLVGGTPCQSFSVAGLRGGLSDERGNLALEFVRLAAVLRPRWILWENVPGVLSSGDGRDFGSILGALAQLGYGWAYRVLDAQYWGVPQRRRRVFLVGRVGGLTLGAAQVLFERESLRGNSAARTREGKEASPGARSGAGDCGWQRSRDGVTFAPDVVGTLSDGAHQGGGFDGAPVGFNWQNGGGYGTANEGLGITRNGSPPLSRNQTPAVSSVTIGVRRLTPTECERLQGFPDGWTDVPYRGKPASDGPRYKALGNSMAVPVMRWIGERIKMVDEQQPAT